MLEIEAYHVDKSFSFWFGRAIELLLVNEKIQIRFVFNSLTNSILAKSDAHRCAINADITGCYQPSIYTRTADNTQFINK